MAAGTEGLQIFSRVGGGASHPCPPEMDATHWVLLTVLVISIAFFWTRILHHITE